MTIFVARYIPHSTPVLGVAYLQEKLTLIVCCDFVPWIFRRICEIVLPTLSQICINSKTARTAGAMTSPCHHTHTHRWHSDYIIQFRNSRESFDWASHSRQTKWKRSCTDSSSNRHSIFMTTCDRACASYFVFLFRKLKWDTVNLAVLCGYSYTTHYFFSWRHL